MSVRQKLKSSAPSRALASVPTLPESIGDATKQIYVAFHFVREDGSQGHSHTVLTGLSALDTMERLKQADAAIKQMVPGLAVVTILGWWALVG